MKIFTFTPKIADETIKLRQVNEYELLAEPGLMNRDSEPDGLWETCLED